MPKILLVEDNEMNTDCEQCPAAHTGLGAGTSPAGPTSLGTLRELRVGEPAPHIQGEASEAAAPKPKGRRRVSEPCGLRVAQPRGEREAKRGLPPLRGFEGS